MDREEPQTEKGRSGFQPKSNVVHFPRDWLGPRDELVPIGTGIAGNSDADDSAPAPPDDVPEPDPPPSPPSASDFWGEHSAEIHDVLQGPPPVLAGPRRDPPPARRRRKPPSQMGRWRRWSQKPAIALGKAEALAGAARAVASRPRRWTNRAVRPLLIGVAGIACAVLVVEAVSEAPSRPVAGTSGPSRLLGSLLKSADLRLGFGQPLGGPGAGAGDRLPARVRDRARTARAGARRARVSHSRLPRARRIEAQPVSSSAKPAPSGAASTVVRVGSGAAAGSGSAVGSGAAAGSGTGGVSGTASGPVGAGAPFGPGHLG